MIFGMSVIVLPMDLLTEKERQKSYLLHSIGISIDEYNISLTEKPYVFQSVIFFIGMFFGEFDK
jgi:hypothetical protein